MSDRPGSFFVIDPGRVMGWSCCAYGGGNLRHGTWRFNHEDSGAAYNEFAKYLRFQLNGMPDPQVGIELLTIVPRLGGMKKNGEQDMVINPVQIAFSAGWQAIAQTVCASMGLRPVELIAISTWRSRTHSKTRAPKGLNEAQRSKWFKEQAKKYADDNGWSYNTADEAESLCMLDAMRMMYEPAYAFDKGKSYEQEVLL